MDVYLLGVRAPVFKPHVEKLGFTAYAIEHHDQLKPCDIAICTGYYNMVPERYFSLARKGMFVVHESDLPEGRGHAPLSWALICDKREIVVTMFKIAKAMDAGDILGKATAPIKIYETILDLREKANGLIVELLNIHLPQIADEAYEAVPQSGIPTYYRRRTPEDSRIDPKKSILEQWNLIRASQNPDYPAFFYIDEVRFNLMVERHRDWKA